MAKTSAEVLIDFSPKTVIDTKCETSNNNDTIGYTDGIVIGQSSTLQNDYFATLEHNIFLLDGTFIIAEPSSKPYGYFGSEVSDNDCKLKNSNIKLILTNLNNGDEKSVVLPGITLYFDKVIHPYLIEYSVTGDLYTNKLINNIKNGTIVVFDDINNIQSIDIKFLDTKFPGMHPRLFRIALGFKYNFTKEDIISLVINEEISPITSVLPVNTAELVVYNFDIMQNNTLKSFQNNNIYALISGIINDEKIELGCFYIDKISSENKYITKISLISLTKQLYDEIIVPDSGYNYKLEDYIDYTLCGGKYTYFIPDDIKSERKIIYFKTGKSKELFQQVLFLYGLMVNDLYNNFSIEKLNTQKIKSILYPSQVIDDVKLEKIEPINVITVDTIDYINPENIGQQKWLNQYNFTTIYQDNITDDSLHLEFERPANIFRYKMFRKVTTDTGYEILEEIDTDDVSKVIQTTSSTGEKIDSFPMVDPGTGTSTSNPIKFSWYNRFYEGYASHYSYTFRPQNSGNITNYKDYVFKIDVAYFIEEKKKYTLKKYTPINENLLYINNPEIFNSKNVAEFAQNTLDYYNNIDLKIEANYINTNINNSNITRAGDTVYMYIDNYNMIKTTIVKQTIDITNGFVTKMTGIANSGSMYSHEYMSTNADSTMYMDDNTLI